jgi:hypothetical protein
MAIVTVAGLDDPPPVPVFEGDVGVLPPPPPQFTAKSALARASAKVPGLLIPKPPVSNKTGGLKSKRSTGKNPPKPECFRGITTMFLRAP